MFLAVSQQLPRNGVLDDSNGSIRIVVAITNHSHTQSWPSISLEPAAVNCVLEPRSSIQWRQVSKNTY